MTTSSAVILVPPWREESLRWNFHYFLSFNNDSTTVFVGRDGKVKNIHTGFNGPATGVHFENLKKDFIEVVESLLNDKK